MAKPELSLNLALLGFGSCDEIIRNIRSDSESDRKSHETASYSRLNVDFNELCEISPSFCQNFCGLEELGLRGNEIACLSESISLLRNLKSLCLDENSLKSLPCAVNSLSKLKFLSIVGNSISFLPEGFGTGLPALEEFLADENDMKSLPDSFCSLSHLRRLQVSDHGMSQLPERFGDLQSLVALDLSCGKLQSLPDSFAELERLEILELSDNHLQSAPKSMASTQCLRIVRLSNNCISGYAPPWLSELVSAEEVDISSNTMTQCPFPDDLSLHCRKLKHLMIGGNAFDRLPMSLGNLRSLQFLHMGCVISEFNRWGSDTGNFIAALPESIGQLENLERLEAPVSTLKYIPESFGHLPRLQHADFARCQLTALPSSIGDRLVSLTYLKLSQNTLESLPSSIGLIPNLEELYVDRNRLCTLPDSMRHLNKLKMLDLFRNCLQEMPHFVMELPSLTELDLEGNPFVEALPDDTVIVLASRKVLGVASRWQKQIELDKAAVAKPMPRGGLQQSTLRQTHSQAFSSALLCTAEGSDVDWGIPSGSMMESVVQAKGLASAEDSTGGSSRPVDDDSDVASKSARDLSSGYFDVGYATGRASLLVDSEQHNVDSCLVEESLPAEDSQQDGWITVTREHENIAQPIPWSGDSSSDDNWKSQGDDCDDDSAVCVATEGSSMFGEEFISDNIYNNDNEKSLDFPGDFRDYVLWSDDAAGFPWYVFRQPTTAIAYKDCFWQPTVLPDCSKSRHDMHVHHPRSQDLPCAMWDLDQVLASLSCCIPTCSRYGPGGQDTGLDEQALRRASDAGWYSTAVMPRLSNCEILADEVDWVPDKDMDVGYAE